MIRLFILLGMDSLEQTASRKLRGAGSWYRHSFVMHGFTNNGEIMGAAIGQEVPHFLVSKK